MSGARLSAIRDVVTYCNRELNRHQESMLEIGDQQDEEYILHRVQATTYLEIADHLRAALARDDEE